ncbi:MAG: hypothetical protein ACE37H_01855 [Phycisphaeraceae bacterium]
MMQYRRTVPGLFVLACCLCLSLGGFAQEQADAEDGDAKPNPKKLDLDLDKDVLVFVEPVREDGTIDYIAALNKKYSEGVTNENNAFRALYVLFEQEVDEGNWMDDAGHIASVKAALGVTQEELAASPKYVSWYTYAEDHGVEFDRANDIYIEYWDGPYDAREASLYVQWLKEVEPALLLAMQALQKPAYYCPMFGGTGEAKVNWSVLSPHLGHHRALRDGLMAWAFYKAMNGEPERVIDVITAIQRLADFQAREPFVLSVLTAIGLDTTRWTVVAELIEKRALPEPVLKQIDSVFQSKPSHDKAWADAAKIGEKAIAMDYYQRLLVSRVSSDEMLGAAEDFIDDLTLERVDPDRGLRLLDRHFNQLIKIAEIPDFSEREKAGEAYADALEERVDALGRLQPGTKNEYTDWVTTSFFQTVTPAVYPAARIQLSSLAKERMTRIAIAVERYRLANDALPESLDQVVPRYLRAVPIDPYDKQPIRYMKDESGFNLYSVGPNLEDDGGRDHRYEGDLVIKIAYEINRDHLGGE